MKKIIIFFIFLNLLLNLNCSEIIKTKTEEHKEQAEKVLKDDTKLPLVLINIIKEYVFENETIQAQVFYNILNGYKFEYPNTDKDWFRIMG